MLVLALVHPKIATSAKMFTMLGRNSCSCPNFFLDGDVVIWTDGAGIFWEVVEDPR